MVDFSDVGDTLEKRDRKNNRSVLEVCRCGHSARSHLSVRNPGGYKSEGCKVGAISCNCVGYEGIIQVPTVKYFRYSTGASGKEHPLILGWAKTQKMITDGDIVPLSGYECAFTGCMHAEDRKWPIMWDTKFNRPAGNIDTGVTYFICETHLKENNLGHILPVQDES